MKLVTYNIQFSLGKDHRLDLARIAEAVRGADIIALQEVTRYMPRAEEIDQPARLAELLPEHFWIYGPPPRPGRTGHRGAPWLSCSADRVAAPSPGAPLPQHPCCSRD